MNSSQKTMRGSFVGVDFGPTEIRIVRLRPSPDEHYCFERHCLSPLIRGFEPGSEGFVSALRDGLNEVCDHPRETAIWAVIGVDRVRIHHLKIPAVALGQLREAVYWAMQREESFVDEEAIIDFEIEPGERKEGEAISVTGFLVSREDVEHLKATFAAAGFPLAGILLPLSAALNPIRASRGNLSAAPFSFIHIGVHSSRISVVEEDRARMTRIIPIGLNTLVDALTEGLDPRPTASEAADLVVDLDRVSERESRWKNEEVLAVLSPALERLSRHIERTLTYYQTTYKSQRIEHIYLEGNIAGIARIVKFIEAQTGTKVSPPDLLDSPVLQPGQALPETGRKQLALAFGAALSKPERTPNLLCTWDDRERVRQGNRINRVIFTLFLAFVAACGTFYAWQQLQLRELLPERDRLSRSLAATPDLTDAMVMAALNEAKQRDTRLREAAARYESVALLAEIDDLTPPHVRLDSVSARLGDGSHLRMEGIINGENRLLDTLLAMHVAQLEESLLLKGVQVEESSLREASDGIALHFVLTMETTKPLAKATK